MQWMRPRRIAGKTCSGTRCRCKHFHRMQHSGGKREAQGRFVLPRQHDLPVQQKSRWLLPMRFLLAVHFYLAVHYGGNEYFAADEDNNEYTAQDVA